MNNFEMLAKWKMVKNRLNGRLKYLIDLEHAKNMSNLWQHWYGNYATTIKRFISISILVISWKPKSVVPQNHIFISSIWYRVGQVRHQRTDLLPSKIEICGSGCKPKKVPDYANQKIEYFLKDSSDPSHFIFEINVGMMRIRHRTTLKLNFYIDSKSTKDQVI